MGGYVVWIRVIPGMWKWKVQHAGRFPFQGINGQIVTEKLLEVGVSKSFSLNGLRKVPLETTLSLEVEVDRMGKGTS